MPYDGGILVPRSEIHLEMAKQNGEKFVKLDALDLLFDTALVKT